jgi:hypothetical protein
MAELLAECQDCGCPFIAGEIGSGGFTLGQGGQDVYIGSMEIHSGQVTFGNVEVGTCPRCGGTGRIPDGVYDTLRSTVTILRQLDTTHRLWIVEALRNLPQDEAPSADQLGELLRDVPAQTRAFLARLLTGDTWRYWLPIVIAVSAIIIQHRDAKKATDSARRDAEMQIEESRTQAEESDRELHAEVDRLVQAIIAADDQPVESTLTSTTTTTAASKLGRNQPCWCGSRVKFKYCHGP